MSRTESTTLPSPDRVLLDALAGAVGDVGSRPIDRLAAAHESRQLGELFVGWDDAHARLVHAIHTIHLEAPYTPDAPVNALWDRW